MRKEILVDLKNNKAGDLFCFRCSKTFDDFKEEAFIFAGLFETGEEAFECEPCFSESIRNQLMEVADEKIR